MPNRKHPDPLTQAIVLWATLFAIVAVLLLGLSTCHAHDMVAMDGEQLDHAWRGLVIFAAGAIGVVWLLLST